MRKLSEHTTERAAIEARDAYNRDHPHSAHIRRTSGMKRRWAVMTPFDD